MTKLKVMTVVGTRPEIIKLSRVIAELDRYCEHILVHTGQNFDYELNEIFFRDLDIRRPDVFLDAAGSTAAETIGRILIAVDKTLADYCPEAILILGDTNSCLAAIAAKRRHVPVFHMEAGNRCFDYRVPEEINRRIVDHVSDMNLTYSEIAREYLLREGIPPDQVIKTGSPMREVLEFYRTGIDRSDVLERLELQSRHYFVVSSHREENVDDPANISKLFGVLNEIAERYKEPVIFSTHPRTGKKIREMGLAANARVVFAKPFGFFDYVKLQKSARCVLSDSGTITEESSILNFPAVNLRDIHERPEGFEEAAVMLSGLSSQRIFQILAIIEDQPRGEKRLLQMVQDYLPLNVSSKILRILHSYTDVINRKVWHRQPK